MSALRPYAPLLALLGTLGLGWMIFIRPVTADQSRAAGQLTSLRQREVALRRELGESSPRGVDTDPAAAFARQVTSGDASPALVEQLARMASAARARNLLIETVEPSQLGPDQSARNPLQRDPRVALFDVPVSHTPIRVVFDTDYASLGRFLWAFRNLPTTVEVRALSIGPVPPDPGDDTTGTRTDILRVSLTLHAYTQSAPTVALALSDRRGVEGRASNTSRNGAAQ